MDAVLIKDIRPGMKNITVTFIILEIGNPTQIKDNREVRTLKVADQTACINLSVWDEPGQLLQPGDIIRLTKAHANIWRNCLTLYPGKNGDFDKIGNFTMVFNEQLNMSEPNMTFDIAPETTSAPVNNGTLNNGGKSGPRPQAPPMPSYNMNKPSGPRFPADPGSSNSNKSNKLNSSTSSKPGRGAPRNVVRR